MILNANALAIPLADKSVNTIVTSPPYYGLRDYGTAKWEGGDPNCKHSISMPTKWNDPKRGYEVLRPEVANRGGDSTRCHLCGAIRIDEQIGLEQTPDEYIANLVAVFRECKRILRDDGTLWVNIGDSYFSDTKGSGGPTPKQASNTGSFYEPRRFERTNDMKPKDLIGIPWMLAFALRADGWYLRQDIIWAKPNPMPESIKDRCTKSHEYIFLLSKSARYYYDNEAVKEESIESIRARKKNNGESAVDTKMRGHHGNCGNTGTRNKRDVWTVTTKSYKGAHFATFNPELIKPCILAGAPETCCAKCGAPYERIIEREKPPAEVYTDSRKPDDIAAVSNPELGKVGMGQKLQDWYNEHPQTTTGFQPTCDCNAGTSSGIVFDPFVGSGTTVATAIQLGRKGIGLDLSLTYLYENAKDRIKAEMLPLLTLINQSETQEQKCTKN